MRHALFASVASAPGGVPVESGYNCGYRPSNGNGPFAIGFAMYWYVKAFRHYVDFQGRARRRECWQFLLWNALAMIALAALTAIPDSIEVTGRLFILYYLAVFIPSVAVMVRRLHDLGRTGVWILIVLVPYVGTIWLLIYLVQNGQPHENRFGPDPKAIPER